MSNSSTRHYSASPARWRPILDRIKGVLGLDSAVTLEESVRSLLSQGRKLDAIRLLRSEQSLSLEAARARVEGLQSPRRP